MTTGIATLEMVIADSFVSYDPCFTGGKKVWLSKGTLWTGAGSAKNLAQFRLWTFGRAKRPVIEKQGEDESEETTKMEVLQVRKDGIYLWINDAIPEFVDSPFFAVGSGGAYAMGALSMGATPIQALEVAAKFSAGTRGPFHSLTFPQQPARKNRAHKRANNRNP